MRVEPCKERDACILFVYLQLMSAAWQQAVTAQLDGLSNWVHTTDQALGNINSWMSLTTNRIDNLQGDIYNLHNRPMSKTDGSAGEVRDYRWWMPACVFE